MTDREWLGDPTVFHGEGAFWDPSIDGLRYVDMLRGDIHTLRDGEPSRSHVGDVAAVIRRREAGGYIVAVERGFLLLDAELRVEQEIPVFDDPEIRMNEGGCDPAGRFYCGSTAYDERPGGGALYRLDPDLGVHVVREGVTLPNGLVWSPDGTTAFHADSAEQRIYAYDVDPVTGDFGEQRVHVELGSGSPDGVAIDEEGGLWVAVWSGGHVRRFDASGALSETVDVGVTNPTSCAFGGADGRTLFVTSSKKGLEAPEEHAGQVLAVRVRVRGAAVHAFRG
ncbi:Sugar lactone lactonase YvrE [Nocardioides terrae]|uniref:Sugar lactone lactonase YvrE n=1 Tax=Nocardioides terrae TaxID=574651 RepID=A0A1I1LT08_9ACTN|nr:SMP-30/gluconolactonase/LRE family protein [Nocardioides terrae]SFC72600.1 Sugar lactone lactonase YvrE [Nocardioides terrae]